MARQIDFSKKLTADEEQYVADRPWLRQDAELQGFDLAASADDEFEVEGGYAEWTVDQLKEELGNRELSKGGSKPELISRLEEDDTANEPDEE